MQNVKLWRVFQQRIWRQAQTTGIPNWFFPKIR
jgi:hypothetical protein